MNMDFEPLPLEEKIQFARQDDILSHLAPSDIRALLGEITQLRGLLDQAQQQNIGLLKRLEELAISKWTKELPTETGSYWFAHHSDVRVVKVWGNMPDVGGFYTNEDGGASVTDGIYQGGHWMGPMKAPVPPKK